MTPTLVLSSRTNRRQRVHHRWMAAALACFLPTIAAQAQVTFTGARPNINLGSQPVGSRSVTTGVPFMIAANTKVGSIAVLTTGGAGRDFAQAAGSTCTATTFAAATNCMVNVNFKPAVPGVRMGAVVFFSGPHNSGTVLASVPVFGLGTGPQLVFGPGGSQTTVGSNFISPEGVAVDAAGDVYITDVGLQEVFKVTPAGKQTTVGSGLQVPGGVALDGAGNVYIADSQAAAVFKVTPGGVQTTIGSGFSFPTSVAVDGAGNVYVSDPFIPTVFKITPAGTQTQVGSGYNTPAGVAVDAAGNVYVADTFSSVVFKVTAGGKQTTVGTGLVSPAAVAVDAAGTLYIADDAANSLIEVTSAGVQTTAVEGLNVPGDVVLDGSGNLYVSNSFSSEVVKINRASAPSLTFATTKINQTSSDSPKTVQVENIGNAKLNFSAVSFPADFRQSGATTCASGTSLSAGAGCALAIEFSPVAPLSGKPSAVLTEAVTLTTNNLNVAKKLAQVSVNGKELP